MQNAESLSAQNAESPWCTVQSAESLMPTPQCRFSDVERRLQSAAEIRVFFSVLPQILGWGAGGKSSGKVGKWENGKVGKWGSRENAISEISRFFMDFLF